MWVWRFRRAMRFQQKSSHLFKFAIAGDSDNIYGAFTFAIFARDFALS
jgi:hypothetical protein